MKALSISQPFGWLISNGYKDIENRDWSTDYRGIILIHAPQKFDRNFFPNGKTLFLPYAEQICGAAIAAVMPERLEDYIKPKEAGIVGYATLAKVVTNHTSPWFCGKYGFVLTQRHPVDFIPLRGHLGLFEVPPEIEAHMNHICDLRAWEEDAKDMAQITREWREYRLEGDETPDTRPWEERIS